MANTRGRGIQLNRAEMADAMGITPPTLDEWIRRGCPAVQKGARGRPWIFNSAQVMRWREDDVRAQSKGVEVSSKEELNRRKLEAEVELVELELATATALVAPVEEFERAMQKGFAEVRSRLRGVLPARVAARVAALTGETEIKEVLREEIDEVLEALANAALVEEDDFEEEDAE
ncbi:hypothetical protein GCM10016455_05620 [Aliiroseovarius zhejiangensis]|uniref:Terminase small subunit n=1 Tax=Aliiroseovarius zhejiangensis TaxID=1632025 RepID=A0ABQ3ISY9_9RHOB|nr:terminase small subunit [Aliiroseovarius zhejiangensis]GHE88365.1 hypothetical protein GCM10016455_05620 [Aliiroseovarius zhejiangensis]